MIKPYKNRRLLIALYFLAVVLLQVIEKYELIGPKIVSPVSLVLVIFGTIIVIKESIHKYNEYKEEKKFKHNLEKPKKPWK